MVICLERGADLHMVQLMPLPLTVSSFSKIQISPFWYRLTKVVPEKGQLNVCVCVCVCVLPYSSCSALLDCFAASSRTRTLCLLAGGQLGEHGRRVPGAVARLARRAGALAARRGGVRAVRRAAAHLRRPRDTLGLRRALRGTALDAVQVTRRAAAPAPSPFTTRGRFRFCVPKFRFSTLQQQ